MSKSLGRLSGLNIARHVETATGLTMDRESILLVSWYIEPWPQTKVFPPGFEPGTFRVLGERDNHYTTETAVPLRSDLLHTSLFPFEGTQSTDDCHALNGIRLQAALAELRERESRLSQVITASKGLCEGKYYIAPGRARWSRGMILA